MSPLEVVIRALIELIVLKYQAEKLAWVGGKALGLKEYEVVRVSVSSSSISVTINSNHSKHMLNCVDNEPSNSRRCLARHWLVTFRWE